MERLDVTRHPAFENAPSSLRLVQPSERSTTAQATRPARHWRPERPSSGRNGARRHHARSTEVATTHPPLRLADAEELLRQWNIRRVGVGERE